MVCSSVCAGCLNSWFIEFNGDKIAMKLGAKKSLFEQDIRPCFIYFFSTC